MCTSTLTQGKPQGCLAGSPYRNVAQFGRALALGARCRRFESCHSDLHSCRILCTTQRRTSPVSLAMVHWSLLRVRSSGEFTSQAFGSRCGTTREPILAAQYTSFLCGTKSHGLETEGYVNNLLSLLILNRSCKKTLTELQTVGMFCLIYAETQLMPANQPHVRLWHLICTHRRH